MSAACLLDVEKLMVKVFPYNISISWSLRAENCTGPTTFQASAESHEGVNASSGLFSVTDCDTNEKMVLLTLTSLKCSTMYEITVTADVLGFNQEIIANFAKDTPLPGSGYRLQRFQLLYFNSFFLQILIFLLRNFKQ